MLAICAGMLVIPVSIAGTAYGQETCFGPHFLQGEYLLSPQYGPAGSTVAVSGYYIFNSCPGCGGNTLDGGSTPATSIAGPVMVITWNERRQVLAELPAEGGQDNTARFSGTIIIPEDAIVGGYEVAFHATPYNDPACLAFQVTESVFQDAYVEAAMPLATNLPGTGLMLLVPLTGFMAMGVGGYIIRRRRAWRLR